ncbi:hypothetical protein CBR_g49726 [Chara braunii]|uniref:Uncharacterized protein n=1 Tax=Chara braunii TaxID=69332 RepID=A0A388M5L6_CHABU|nr:hypothetical protein CBR_g49726 [Chara braunii]|eukprot:GBG89878.1 hypothetical protein CBR_g49726 [Chara braunii]
MDSGAQRDALCPGNRQRADNSTAGEARPGRYSTPYNARRHLEQHHGGVAFLVHTAAAARPDHNVKILAAVVKVADNQLKQLDARIATLEARPSQAAPGCTTDMTDMTKQLNGRIDHVVNLIGDIGVFNGPDMISSTVAAIKTDITKLQTKPDAATKNYKMLHFDISKFDDHNKTDALAWWQRFLAEASCRTVPTDDMMKALYLQLIGGA